MGHYRDKTFCTQSYECGNEECDRWVDFEVETEGLPISLSNFRTETCGYEEREDEQNY